MAKKSSKQQYENNPFFIATSGITLLFNFARGVAYMLFVLSIIGLFGNIFNPNGSSDTNPFQNWDMSQWLLLVVAASIIGLALVMVGALFGGVNAYTSARLSQGEEVSIREAFRESFDKLWSFIWLEIIIFVKVLLWSLLLIVPGIIMAVRYSLASVAFFDDNKNLRGNDAIKESLRLTRGAWITTYATKALFNIITLGVISSIVSTGSNAILYRQYQHVGNKKPAAHWLSWLTLVLPGILLAILLLGIIFVAIVFGLLGQATF